MNAAAVQIINAVDDIEGAVAVVPSREFLLQGKCAQRTVQSDRRLNECKAIARVPRYLFAVNHLKRSCGSADDNKEAIDDCPQRLAADERQIAGGLEKDFDGGGHRATATMRQYNQQLNSVAKLCDG